VGGISLQEMNLLEAEFLKLINWSLWVEPQAEYECYLAGVLRQFPDFNVPSASAAANGNNCQNNNYVGTSQQSPVP